MRRVLGGERAFAALVLLAATARGAALFLRSLARLRAGTDEADGRLFAEAMGNGFRTYAEATYLHVPGPLPHFRVHLDLVNLLAWPWFAAFGPPGLAACQAAAWVAGVLLSYAVARRLTGHRFPALAVALAYLALPCWDRLPASYETDWFAAPALLLLLWALVAGRRRLAWVAAVLALAVKEDMGLTAGALALWWAWRRGERWPLPLALAAVAVSAAEFAWLARWPYSGTVFGYWFAAWGNSPAEDVRAMLTDPQQVWRFLTGGPKLRSLAALAARWGLLPLLAPDAALVAWPTWLRLLLQPGTYRVTDAGRYLAPVAPAATLAACAALVRLRALARRLRPAPE